MIQKIIIAVCITGIVCSAALNYFYVLNTTQEINKKILTLSDENKQDLANAVILQDQLDLIINNLNKVQLTKVNDLIQKVEKSIQNITQNQSLLNTQFQQQQQKDNQYFKNVDQNITQTTTLNQTTQKNILDLQNQLQSIKTKIPTDAQTAITNQSIQQMNDLIKQVPQFQQQITDLQNKVQNGQQQQTNDTTNQTQTLSLSNLNQQISQLQQKINDIQTQSTQANNISQKLQTQYLMINASSNKNDPTANGIYVLASSPQSIPSITVRTAANSVTNPYISIDTNGKFGWSLGNDVKDQNKFKIVPNWTFDVTKTPPVTIQQINDSTVSFGINNANPTENSNYIFSAENGRSKVQTLDINTPVPADPNWQGKLNVGTQGTLNPSQNGIHIKPIDNNSDAIFSTRLPNQSQKNAIVSFDHEGMTGWSAGLNAQNNNQFVIANDWANLSINPRMLIDTSGNIKFNTNTFTVCDNSGNNCKQLK